jgi:hypothetical protein
MTTKILFVSSNVMKARLNFDETCSELIQNREPDIDIFANHLSCTITSGDISIRFAPVQWLLSEPYDIIMSDNSENDMVDLKTPSFLRQRFLSKI